MSLGIDPSEKDVMARKPRYILISSFLEKLPLILLQKSQTRHLHREISSRVGRTRFVNGRTGPRSAARDNHVLRLRRPSRPISDIHRADYDAVVALVLIAVANAIDIRDRIDWQQMAHWRVFFVDDFARVVDLRAWIQ